MMAFGRKIEAIDDGIWQNFDTRDGEVHGQTAHWHDTKLNVSQKQLIIWQEKMARVHPTRLVNHARWLRRSILLLIVVLVLLHAIALLGPANPHFRPAWHSYPWMTLVQKLLAGGAALLSILALIQLLPMLKGLIEGDMFSTRVTGPFRRFSALMLLSVLITTLVTPLVSVLTSTCGPAAGPGCPTVGVVDLRGILLLVVSVTFFLVARLLDEARRIEEDNRQIV